MSKIIMTPRQLFDWASTSIPAVHFDYCTNEERSAFLRKDSKHVRTIPGTRKFHLFIPTSSTTVQVRHFSASTTFKEEKVTSLETDVPLESLSGFVTCVREGYWWLACVLDIHTDSVRVTFLHPNGPSNSFKYQDFGVIPANKILTVADPRTRTGRTFREKATLHLKN